MLAGRRGEIVWKKAGFLGGGGRRDYDAYEALGLLGPVMLGQLLHTFGWGEEAYEARAIPLDPAKGFAGRAYARDWAGPLLMLSGLAFLPLCCSGVSIVATIVTGVVLLVSGLTLLHSWPRGRDRNIRLVLGRHARGSSDPYTWHPDLLDDVVDPAEAFRVKSFAKLAEKSLDEKDWVQAMWAARLSAALEDEDRGEALTDEVLAEPAVKKKLARVRGNPDEWRSAFGEPVSLKQWVRGNPRDAVTTITWRIGF